MSFASKGTHVNPITGKPVPNERTDGDLIAVDEEYYYIAIPNNYMFGVPVVTTLSRDNWVIY